MDRDETIVSQAIIAWIGWGERSWPSQDERRIVDSVGSDKAAELLPRLRELKKEFFESNARHTVANLQDMGEAAAGEFRRQHPEISDEAVQALTWLYTYTYK
jgi:hypothetical protein